MPEPNYPTSMKSIIYLLLTCVIAHAHTTVDLKVAHQTAPLGVDDAQPRLSWSMEGGEKGLAQSAYQILVATRAEKRLFVEFYGARESLPQKKRILVR